MYNKQNKYNLHVKPNLKILVHMLNVARRENQINVDIIYIVYIILYSHVNMCYTMKYTVQYIYIEFRKVIVENIGGGDFYHDVRKYYSVTIFERYAGIKILA